MIRLLPTPAYRQPRRQRGVSLIEVLVSLVILSLGVLSVVALQLVSKRNNADAGQRTIAAQLAYDIIERMRANSSAAALNGYLGGAAPFVGRNSIEVEPVPDCDSDVNNTNVSSCTGPQLALHDLWLWEQALDGAAEQTGGESVGGLLFPTGCITGPAGGGSGIYRVSVAWRGTVSLPSDATVACGLDAEEEIDGVKVKIYDDPNVPDGYRRTVTFDVFITARGTS